MEEIQRGDEIFLYSYLGDLEKISKFKASQRRFLNKKDTNGYTPLLLACSNNHTELAKYLIQIGAQINKTDENSTTPLHWASYLGNIQLVQFLIEKNAQIQAQDRYGIQPIHLAALRNNVSIVRLLMEKYDHQQRIEDSLGITPLHLAAFAGHDEVIKVLLEYDCTNDVNKRDNNFVTPLHLASSCNHISTVKLLLENGAKIKEDQLGRLPHHWAASCGNNEMLNYLIEKENFYDWCDKNYFTPLFLATLYGHNETIVYLLERGDELHLNNGNCGIYRKLTNLDEPDALIDKYFHRFYKLLNAFLWACAFCSINIVKKFILTGMDCHVTGKMLMNTALHTAAAFGNHEILSYLIDQGCELNAKDLMYQNTALCWGAGHGYRKVVEILLQNGADTTESLCWAAASGRLDIVQMLIGKSNKPLLDETDEYFHRTPLHWAVLSFAIGNNMEIIKIFQQLYFATDDFENLPIHYAVYGGHIDVVRFLVEKRSRVINSRNRYHEFPLTIAIDNGYQEILEIILDFNDVPVLHRAAVYGRLDELRYLLEGGESPNIYDNIGIFPIHYAVAANQTKAVQILINHGARVNVNSSIGLPLCKACEIGNFVIVDLLMDAGAVMDDGNEFDEYGLKTPLYYAIFNYHSNLMKHLLALGCDATDLLHMVARYGTVSDLEFALQFDNNVNTKDDYFSTPIFFSNYENTKLLIAKGADVNYMVTRAPLHAKISYGSIDDLEILVENGADINILTEFGSTPLRESVLYNRTDLFKWLLANGANIEVSNDCGLTLLQDIVTHNRLEMLKILLTRNIDVNITEKNNVTLLHMAAEVSHSSILKQLIDNGANINALDNENRTPLTLAVHRRDYQKIKILIVHGADVNLDKNIINDFSYVYDSYLSFSKSICEDFSNDDMAIIDLLYNAGLQFKLLNIPPDIIYTITVLKNYIAQCESCPLSLKQICRICCKNFYKNYYHDFVRNITFLPLNLKKYLLYDVIDL